MSSLVGRKARTIEHSAVNGPWKRLVYGHPAHEDGAVNRHAYTFCVLGQFYRPLKRATSTPTPPPVAPSPGPAWPGPLPADGGRGHGERLLTAGADLIALGRAFLANPDLVERIRTGAPLNAVRDNLMYVGGSGGYSDCPTLTSPPKRAAR